MRSVLLVLSSIAVSSAGQVPDWVRDPPRGYSHSFIIGYGYDRNIDSSRAAAYADVIKQLSEERGINVGLSVSDYRQSGREHSVESDLRWSSEAFTLDSLRIMDWHNTVEYGGLWHTRMLIRLPAQERRWKPPGPLLAVSGMILPGSPQLILGIRSRGGRIMTAAAACVIGSLASYYLRDQYGETMRRSSILFGVGYLILGVGSAWDGAGSRYLTEYD